MRCHPRLPPRTADVVIIGKEQAQRIVEQTLRDEGTQAHQRVHQRDAGNRREAVAHLRDDPRVQILGLVGQVEAAGQLHRGRGPPHAKITQGEHTAVDRAARLDLIEGKAITEHFVKVQGDAPWQGLKTQHPEQSPDAGFHLKKLAAPGLQAHLAGQAGKTDRIRHPAPAQIALEHPSRPAQGAWLPESGEITPAVFKGHLDACIDLGVGARMTP